MDTHHEDSTGIVHLQSVGLLDSYLLTFFSANISILTVL